jgi:hypothetical protein
VNRARVAALLRELAAAIESDDGAAPQKPMPSRKRPRAARTLTPPADVTDLDIARARDSARKAGLLIR